MDFIEMKKFADSLRDCGLSRKDMLDAYESKKTRCENNLSAASQRYTSIMFDNKYSKKEKREQLVCVNMCMDEYLKAFDEFRAVKLFYKIGEEL